MDRDPKFDNLSIVERAARILYLNKACFNGLYRVNSSGYFNVPENKNQTIRIIDLDNITNVHKFLKKNKISITNNDFQKAVSRVKKGDFVYFDPPYDSFENQKNFTSYSQNNFDRQEQERLFKTYKRLSNKGAYVMLSNHNTKFIRELYKDFNIYVVNVKRLISSNSKNRGEVEEVIITNY